MAARKIIAFDAAGFTEEVNQGVDTFTMAGLTMTAPIAMGASKITGLADGTAATDAATKGQLDTVAAGLNAKGETRVATAAALPANIAAGAGAGKTLTMSAVGILTVDGVALLLNDLVLVKDESVGADIDHGIYKVSTAGTVAVAAVLTRDVGFDGSPANEVGNADFVFVQTGTTNGSSGWYVATASPITVDTTPIDFDQFSGAGAIPTATSAPGGGVLGKATFDSNLGLVAAAGVVSVALAATSGLQFTGGALDSLEDPNGGLEYVAAGGKIKLNGTTLALAAAGASVLGVPAAGSWQIGGVATSANVTAPNLATLTGGANADALHTHAGAAANINAGVGGVAKGDPLYISANDTVLASTAANGTQTQGFIGVAGAAAAVGAPAPISNDGDIVAGVLAGATAGAIVYNKVGGGLSLTKPGATGNHMLAVGKAVNATDMIVYAQYLGRIA